ncbi:MAG TPA: LLM class F420-dependent oxidoreductase [Jatrophihabitans sp.]|jgi:probable F420-dependent oxidoreductase|uniref:LLM class F420-dependent oxidoreductase n=1 Tax=Jatrophihabitans sp. TaxID=1932789 RepID=UPI002EE807BC
MTGSWGVTVPLPGLELAAHAEVMRALPDWGYTDAWSSEVAGPDAFTPLALAAVAEPRLYLGTAIVPVFTRGPVLIAQSAAALAELAPGRFSLGLGASSPAIVEQWNGIGFDQPYRRTRDVLRFVSRALAGEKVSANFDTFTVSGFRLEQPPTMPVPILLAALRPQMLALAGREAQGAILNWLAATDVGRCVAEIGNPASRIVARVFVCPTEDADYARTLGRRLIAAYLNVPAYAEFHRWLGRGPRLERMWQLWEDGDRAGAAQAVPNDVIDELVLHGNPRSCRDQVLRYVEAGVQIPVLAVLPSSETADPAGLAAVLAELGPAGLVQSPEEAVPEATLEDGDAAQGGSAQGGAAEGGR